MYSPSSGTSSAVMIDYSNCCLTISSYSCPIRTPSLPTKAEIARRKMKKYLITLSVDQNYKRAPALDYVAPSFMWRVQHNAWYQEKN